MLSSPPESGHESALQEMTQMSTLRHRVQEVNPDANAARGQECAASKPVFLVG